MVIRDALDHHIERVHRVDRFHNPHLFPISDHEREPGARVGRDRRCFGPVQSARGRDLGSEIAVLDVGEWIPGFDRNTLSVDVEEWEGGTRGTTS